MGSMCVTIILHAYLADKTKYFSSTKVKLGLESIYDD